jgi:hypothetical protein
MPALLPDGTQSRLSVSGVLTGEPPAELPGNGRSAIAGETVEAERVPGPPDEEER